MLFNVAQTFTLDQTVLQGSDLVCLSSIDLYFVAVPYANTNASGITDPGVTMYVTGTTAAGQPDITNVIEGSTVRLEYNQIATSLDASLVTTAAFSSPVLLSTNTAYAVVLSYDGDEPFTPWTYVKGEDLLGSTQTATGVLNTGVGQYFQYSSDSTSGSTTSWTNQAGTALVFTVWVDRYNVSANASAPTPTDSTLLANSEAYEFIAFDRASSIQLQGGRLSYGAQTSANVTMTGFTPGAMIVGERSWAVQQLQPGTISVSNSSNVVTASGVNFNTLLSQSIYGETYIVFHSNTSTSNLATTFGNNGSGNYNQLTSAADLRQVVQVVSNTQVQLDSPPSFTDPNATFSIVPVGSIYYVSDSKPIWINNPSNTACTALTAQTVVYLEASSANTTLNFQQGSADYVGITAGGTGYSNTDYVVISATGYAVTNAQANVSTNATGGIFSLNLNSVGAGFVGVPSGNVVIQVINSSGLASVGTGASFQPHFGTTIRTERSGLLLQNSRLFNFPVHAVNPSIATSTSKDTAVGFELSTLYAENVNTASVVVQDLDTDTLDLIGKTYVVDGAPPAVILSHSYEVSQAQTQVSISNVSLNTQSSLVLSVNAATTTDFSVPVIYSPDVYAYHYVINNDYTNENTRYGNSLAKHISSQITLNAGQFAEAATVIVGAYRPPKTDVKVFVKLYNNAVDPDSFDDKDWTLLYGTSNTGVYSSATDNTDIQSYTFALPSSPNTVFVSGGTAQTVLNQANVIGSNSTYANDYMVGDLVKVYPPLFPQNYAIGVVSSVTNNTLLTLSEPITNTSVTGTGLNISLLGRQANAAANITGLGYPQQAFAYGTNENVARYYTTTMTEVDTYDVFAIKLVLLSSTPGVIPRVHSLQAIATSV